MNRVRIILIWVIGLLTVLPVNGEEIRPHAKRKTASSIWWSTKRTDGRNGLYTRQNRSVGRGVLLSANAIYYYGDIDMLDQAFIHGFQPQNISAGGSAKFGYLHPAARSATWRFTLGGGYMHGNDSARMDLNPKTGLYESAGKGMFRNIFAEATAGIEWYPFKTCGFYIYGGLGFNVSSVHYDFFKTDFGSGQRLGFVPLLDVEIGYNFELTQNWFLAIDVGLHQALIDVPGVSFDAWPLYETSRFQWGDGYFQIGVTLSYRWQTCKHCMVRGNK